MVKKPLVCSHNLPLIPILFARRWPWHPQILTHPTVVHYEGQLQARPLLEPCPSCLFLFENMQGELRKLEQTGQVPSQGTEAWYADYDLSLRLPLRAKGFGGEMQASV